MPESAADPLRAVAPPSWSSERGAYRARFARDAADLDAIQRLRFRVFHEELGATVGALGGAGRDADAHDAHSHHLLVEHVPSGAVVGTYRLATAESVGAHGFYAAGEFALDALPSEVLADGVELGRACIDAAHRGRFVLALLWQGIGAYLDGTDKRYLFGCASVPAADLGAALQLAASLRGSPALRSDLRVAPLPAFAVPADAPPPPRDGPIAPPSLLARYLALGAQLCGEPAFDRAFGTLDFFVLFDRARAESTDSPAFPYVGARSKRGFRWPVSTSPSPARRVQSAQSSCASSSSATIRSRACGSSRAPAASARRSASAARTSASRS